MANPSGNHQEPNHASSSFNGVNLTNGNSGPVSVPESSGAAMKHNPGIATEWSAEEQAILEEVLAKYASESSIIRYAKIAMQLQNKTVRDVALRSRWMTKKENSKRRKEENNLTRKSKERKERVSDPSTKSIQFAARTNVPPFAPPMLPADDDDGISCKAIGGPTGDILEENAQILDQISANIATFQIQENFVLLARARENILKVMNDFSDMPEIMKQMPSLQVKINEELANAFLPRSSHQMQ